VQKSQGIYHYSPSDLTLYMASPFASWMSRFAIERPDEVPEKDADDAFMSLLQQMGYEHEDALEAKLANEGKSLVKISGNTQSEKFSATVAAIHSGVDVIVQGRLACAPFAGYSDFLIKVPGASKLGDFHYEVWDTKLASTLKSSFVIQLCCYAEMLEEVQGVRPEQISVALGNGELSVLRTNDFFHYYLLLKQSFLNAQNSFNSDDMPDPAESKSFGNWSSYAETLLHERDHLSQVATITSGQIKKLNAVGISTMQELAQTEINAVPRLSPIIYNRLQQQALIQFKSKGLSKPLFQIIKSDPRERQGLSLMPSHSKMDVFFDIEGFPLDEGGLEYLWGNTYFDENDQRQFIDFWAHNQKQEKQCFQDFIHWVYARWLKDPQMHIYHYANYEIAACRKLMGRYGVCEHEVDQLLRNEVFVDLYKVVKGGLLLGEPRYSIKNVEHLYRGSRETDVGTGGDSVVVYEQWRKLNALGKEGDTWQTSAILKSIRDYNIDDCDSTQELVDWLRVQQHENAIAFVGKTDVVEVEQTTEITKLEKLRDNLLCRAKEKEVIQPELSLITENLAWSLEFHRRESKPIFWKMFDRMGAEESELLDDLDCLAFCTRTDRSPFKIKRSYAYEYSFDANQEFKAACSSYYVLNEETEEGKSLKVNVDRESSDFQKGLLVVKSTKYVPPQLMTLIPDEYVNPTPIPEAIANVVEKYNNNDGDNLAIVDFLSRSTPRINGLVKGSIITGSKDAAENLQQIINAIKNLDNSYLPIQGPPGAGKTYTGKHVIAELVKEGKRVGICSNSHKAINNLLLTTAKYCKENDISASFVCTKETDPELSELDVNIIKNKDLDQWVEESCVIGTTAWGFSRSEMIEQLDYLFIDEAGQVSVANLIAISRCTKNLVLMGDQMQLGQPIQGTHPANSGASILDYLLKDSPTIDERKGIFLNTTYRMHSAVNKFISDAVYEGKLISDIANDKQLISIPSSYKGPLNKEAGVIFMPVEHFGNTQASEEEVSVIVETVMELIGRTFTDKEGQARNINWSDILIVAPYNFQVNKLKTAFSSMPGGDNARVGSVDKFQGQEAPVVILSMCASDANESPRGVDFLFDKNRLNVAISRAQSLAIVVENPALASTSVSGVKQLAKINMFSHLAQYNGGNK
jgi:predicted RecB family nuclease